MFYKAAELVVGLVCMAPLKKGADAKRVYQDVEVTWVSTDGRVCEVRPLVGPKSKKLPDPKGVSFARANLRPPGTKTPEIGYVVI